MHTRKPADLGPILRSRQRLLGVDSGEKALGLALSDPSRTIANPLRTLPRTSFHSVATVLRKLVAAEDIGGIIVGLPVNMDGTEGPAAQSARALAANLEKELGIPTAMWDERLSTAAVTRILLEADTSRKRRAEVVDKLAATYILQGALDHLAGSS